MEKEYELLYHNIENIHPWFIARKKLFASIICKNKNVSILDFGCGSGNFLEYLYDLGYEDITGIEISNQTYEKVLESRRINIYKEFPHHKRYDIILMMDVLEHIKDDVKIINELKSRLTNGGLIIISVPAYQYLWSKHDEVNHHYRRYNRKSLDDCISASKLSISWSTYWNTILFPAIALKRIFIKDHCGELSVPNSFVRRIIYLILLFENFLIRIIRLPFGLSFIAIIKNE